MATFTRGPYLFVRWSLAGALLALALLAAGCGSGGSLALDPVASAAGRTLDKGTGRFDLQTTFTLPLLGRASVSGEGSFDNAKQAMDVTMNVKGVGTGMPGSVELRLLYPALYLRTDGLLPMGGQLPNGKSWVKIDAERTLKNLGVDLASARRPANRRQEYSRGCAVRRTRRRSARRRSTACPRRTTAARSTLEDALDRATAKERKALQRLLDGAKAQGVDATSATFDVWVGDDGLVRRLTQTIGSVGNVTMTFSDYGEPVHIEAPPADETADLSGMVTS